MADVFFGLQLAVHSPPGDPWRLRLQSVVRAHVRDLPHEDQRGLWGSVANLLLEAIDRCALAFWDYVPDGKQEYDDWVSGIEDDSAEPWRPDASGARMDHVLVSAMFLLPEHGASDELVGEACDLPESDWLRRGTLRRLVEVLTQLDFASVRNNAVYLTPGTDGLAFSLQELQGEGYDYLLRVE